MKNWHKDTPKSPVMPYNTLIHTNLMTYQLTITASTVATLNFETEKDARRWMDSWEEQDYKNLDWSGDEATVMELTDDKGKLLRTSYCEMNPNG